MIYNSYADFVRDLQPNSKAPKVRENTTDESKQAMKQWQEFAKKFFSNQQEIKTK